MRTIFAEVNRGNPWDSESRNTWMCVSVCMCRYINYDQEKKGTTLYRKRNNGQLPPLFQP